MVSERKSPFGRPPRSIIGILATFVVLASTVIIWWQIRHSHPAEPTNQVEQRTSPLPLGQSTNPRPVPALVPSTKATAPSDCLWTSPTHGSPIELGIPLDGTQFIALLRPAELWQQSQFVSTWRSCGPSLESWLIDIEQTTGVNRRDVDEILIMAAPGTGASPIDLVARLRVSSNFSIPKIWDRRNEAIDESGERQSEWYAVRSPTASGARILVQATPLEGEGGRLQLMLLTENTTDLLDRPHSAPLLMRDLELLRQHSDQDRQFTVIVGNQFLATHGNDIARLLDGPQWARSDWLRDSTASLLSGVWNDKGFFLEFATTAHWENADRLPERLWQASRRWAQNQAFRAETWKRHARLKIFADKWPAMAQFVLDHMRIGREAEVTMGNLSLPPSATHNICCGLYLTYVSREEQAMEEQKSTSPLTWPQLLGLQISFRSAPASLDAVLDKLQRQIGEMIAGASRLELQIDRAALEKAGVTRNQRLRKIHLNETTVADVLNEITVEAGGRTTENSVLVWIYPRDSASQEKLTAILTTRAAAQALSEFTVLTPN